MQNLVECIPNISEGRDKEKINKIISFLKEKTTAKVLHIEMGASTNRTVITFLCELKELDSVATAFIQTVFQEIDMKQHHGTHPRSGAIDVFPFVALGSTDKKELNIKIEKLAQKVFKQFDIPVYLYALSAKNQKRISLSNIRRGEYENIFEKIKVLKPDFDGQNKNNILKHGAITMGQRDLMIAYNINLATKDISIAKKIAEIIRESGSTNKQVEAKANTQKSNVKKPSGIFKGLKSLGWYIDEYGFTQVSCNIMNYNTAPMHLVFEKISELAKQMGTEVNGSEVIGLIPEKALIDAGIYFNISNNSTTNKANNNLSTKKIIGIAIKKLGLNSIKKFIPEKRILEYLVNETYNIKTKI